jgi:hypothetical protein
MPPLYAIISFPEKDMSMTVAELIALLQTLPQNGEIRIADEAYECRFAAAHFVQGGCILLYDEPPPAGPVGRPLAILVPRVIPAS